jgi:hypothetical protein
MIVGVFLLSLLAFRLAGAVPTVEQAFRAHQAKTCVVNAGGSVDVDDAPAIIEAFDKCGHDGKISFLNTTYHINSVMNITGLKNCEIDLKGTLLVYHLCSLDNPNSTDSNVDFSGVLILPTGSTTQCLLVIRTSRLLSSLVEITSTSMGMDMERSTGMEMFGIPLLVARQIILAVHMH